METKTFSVSGMKCPHCKANVENAIKALDGVSEAVASVADANVTVTYDTSRVTPDDIKRAVDDSGRYELTLSES